MAKPTPKPRISRKLKADPNQLTLSLTITNPTPLVKRVVQALFEMAEAPTPQKPDRRRSDAAVQEREEESIRARIRKQVGILMLTKGWSYHQAYVVVYDAFHTRTGINPTVESDAQGLKTHLDVVFQRPAWPTILLEIINSLITDTDV